MVELIDPMTGVYTVVFQNFEGGETSELERLRGLRLAHTCDLLRSQRSVDHDLLMARR